MIKPDGVKRGLAGKIISRFEDVGLKITALKQVEPETALAQKHYSEHAGKDFYDPLVRFLTSGPVIVMALEGAHAIEIVRKIVGATEPKESRPGTIRGDYCHMSYPRSKERLGVIPNLIHASDSPQTAERELSLWFQVEDYVSEYQRSDADFM